MVEPSASRFSPPPAASSGARSRSAPHRVWGLVLAGTLFLTGCTATDDPGWKYSSWVFPRTSDRDRRSFARKVAAKPRQYHEAKVREGRDLSSRLEAHIRRWLAGRAPARLPVGLLPAGIENQKTRSWTLCRPDDVKPAEQWYYRPAGEIPLDYSKLHFLSPDNHCTYLKLHFVAPYGSRLVIEGEFPHCRFMDYQVTPPFDPSTPADAGFGTPEVPIVDVDIEALDDTQDPQG